MAISHDILLLKKPTMRVSLRTRSRVTPLDEIRITLNETQSANRKVWSFARPNVGRSGVLVWGVRHRMGTKAISIAISVVQPMMMRVNTICPPRESTTNWLHVETRALFHATMLTYDEASE
jgi:hypothetical protein